MNIGIVFGTLSPPICFLTFMNFFVCRLIYGYLMVFAETKKPDLGGAFWVTQLKHVQLGLLVYICLMVGVLYDRSESPGPWVIAVSSAFYLFHQYRKFQSSMNWEVLPFEEI